MDLTSRSSASRTANVIEIADDEENMPLEAIPANPALEDFVLIEDDTDDDYDDYQFIQQSSHARAESRSARAPVQRRNAEPRLPHVYIEKCQLLAGRAVNLNRTERTIKVGDTVEIDPPQQEGASKTGDFLRVMSIIEDMQTGQVTLRGLLFRRSHYLAPMLPRKLNEVCMMVTIDSEDPRPDHVQGREEIPLDYAVRKRKLIITDLEFPVLSWRHDYYYAAMAGDQQGRREIYENQVLVCRHVFAYIFGEGERDKKRNKPHQGLLRYIVRAEADATGGVLTGKYDGVIDLSEDDDTVMVDRLPAQGRGPNKMRQYTGGDGFQGGGGASYAMKLAGLKVKWGFDHERYACKTASRNFRQAKIFKCEASDFPPPGFDAHVDILHFSPPCQAFSPANTSPNATKDEVNTDALFAIPKIVQAVKPRLITLEETYGLLTQQKHQQWFGMLIGLIVGERYSIRWAIHNALEYGISQPRKRLAMIASAPGVPLPEMPKPSHGPSGSGLPQFVSARGAIGYIPIGTPHHNPRFGRPFNMPPWDADLPFTKTITTSNSEAYHWSGYRKLTLRELARLQGFPLNYDFTGSKTEVERMIGNAVPPPYFQRIFEECIKVLRKLDGQQQNRTNVINNDDDGIEDEDDMDVIILDDEPAAVGFIGQAFGNRDPSTRAHHRGASPLLPSSSQRSTRRPGASSNHAIVVDDEDMDIIVLD